MKDRDGNRINDSYENGFGLGPQEKTFILLDPVSFKDVPVGTLIEFGEANGKILSKKYRNGQLEIIAEIDTTEEIMQFQLSQLNQSAGQIGSEGETIA